MHALVTGAAGFIGSHLTERLVSEGHRVRGVDCLTPYYAIEQKSENLETIRRLAGCAVAEVDLLTCDLGSLLEGIDVVFHQAGQPGVRASWASGFDGYVDHNVRVTQRLLEAVRSFPVKRFVFASSSSVYGDAPSYPTSEEDLPRPRSPYGVTKLAAEHLCDVYADNWGVPTVSLRYFTVFGPRQRPDMAMHRMVEAALGGDPFPVFGDGRQIRDFTYVGDVVRANLSAASVEVPAGTVVNIAGGTRSTLVEVIDLVGDLLGRELPIEHRPAEPGDVIRTGGSTERASRVLSWHPEVSLGEGLAAQVAWHVRRHERVTATSGRPV